MDLMIASITALLASGFLAFLLGGRPRIAAFAGAAGPPAALAFASLPIARTLLGGTPARMAIAWNMPLGSLTLEMDALSAFFLAPILVLSVLCAVYGAGYLGAHKGGGKAGPHWFCFNLLAASMVAVCLAGNALFFLAAWEVMAFSSFFLVAFESGREEVRKASWIYMVAAHAGVAFLIPMFLILSIGSPTMDFADFTVPPGSAAAGLCFALALAGFGAKAGIIPLHVWLPEAHPAAPSHVSALMSGVMIKTGIYGLLRVLTLLGPPPAWWGATLIATGAVSGILGVLLALAQHDLKRLLAYHSIENIGIILMGAGLGLMGVSLGSPAMAALGFAGALLHVVNHALFKGLLFLSAGSVLSGTGTRDIEKLGGLLKRMPLTGGAFLVGAVAICGLPPLNGFVSEFLVFLGAVKGAVSGGAAAAICAAVVVAALALIGGLAAACFAKAFGVVFLGEPRTPCTRDAREAGVLLVAPMAVLAALCAFIGLAGPEAARAAAAASAVLAGPGAAIHAEGAVDALGKAVFASCLLAALVVVLALLRRGLLSGREVRKAVTWDCGYAAPSARMQYTASSFAQPITDLFGFFLRQRKHVVKPAGYFPEKVSVETETPDVWMECFYAPLLRRAKSALSKLLILQQGRIQIYVLYLVLTLIAVLIWKLGV